MLYRRGEYLNFDHALVFWFWFMVFGFWNIFYDEDHGARYNSHRLYGKMNEWFHHLPGIAQQFGIRWLFFYGTAPDAFALLS